jgi:serine/threonine protein phosphatase PrpC
LIDVLTLEPGDKVLLSTDGLTNALNDWQLLQELVRLEDANQAAERLLDAANARQASDDATCVTLFVGTR